MKRFFYILLTLMHISHTTQTQPSEPIRKAMQNTNSHNNGYEIENLIDLCHIIADTTNAPESYLLEQAIKNSQNRAKIPMRALISMVRYAGITLKICEAQKDLPVYRIQQLADLLSRYWGTIWERWQQKNVYPVNLELLARSVETTHVTTTNCPINP